MNNFYFTKKRPQSRPLKAAQKMARVYWIAPLQGVHGRNSDNTLIQELLGWQPSIALVDGMARTYEWILEQYKEAVSCV